MLKNLYKDLEAEANKICTECSIYQSNRAIKCHLDYEEINQCDILFLSDSIKTENGHPVSFRGMELSLLKASCKLPFVTAASVKCSDIKETDMSPADANQCRNYLEATIDKIKPKLVFACGNLPMKMLLKKSGIKDKRGNIYQYITGKGTNTTVVPIFHPYMAIAEPRFVDLLNKDIINSIDKVIRNHKDTYGFNYVVVDNEEKLNQMVQDCLTEDIVSFDLETTGLNFLSCMVTTIAIATRECSYAIPFMHRDAQWGGDLPKVVEAISKILCNPKIKKVGHNVKFDMKFLRKYGIEVVNAYDTKVMHRIINENLPNSLKELVKIYFPLYEVVDVRGK